MEHPTVAATINDLGVAQLQRGDVDTAEASFRRSLELRERAYGPDSGFLVGPLQNLSQVMDRRGRWNEAIELLKRAHTLEVASSGSRAPKVAQIVSNLAGAYAEIGRHDEAEAHYRDALSIQHASLGPGASGLGIVLGRGPGRNFPDWHPPSVATGERWGTRRSGPVLAQWAASCAYIRPSLAPACPPPLP
jgi:Flp pilus assembly protein TadD